MPDSSRLIISAGHHSGLAMHTHASYVSMWLRRVSTSPRRIMCCDATVMLLAFLAQFEQSGDRRSSLLQLLSFLHTLNNWTVLRIIRKPFLYKTQYRLITTVTYVDVCKQGPEYAGGDLRLPGHWTWTRTVWRIAR